MTTTCHVFIATSLDGFIARENGAIDWLETAPAPDEDHGYESFMAEVDGLIMGRGTFEKVLSFESWPYQKPVLVASKTLRVADIPPILSKQVQLVTSGPAEIVREVSERGWSRAYVDGGQLIQSFLKEDLIAELTITRVPILLGTGRPLFGPLPSDVKFAHVSTRAFPSGLVQSKYRRA